MTAPRHLRTVPAVALLALLALFVGCTRAQQDEVGVVARVNGAPITLEMLEFQYDQLHFNALSGELPSVSVLRGAYGEILGQLIAQELVKQELAKRGQEVSDEELEQAEASIRADYPEDAFDRMLAEEFVDLRMWRKQLRAMCGIEKFQRLVLRPSIRLDYREVEAHYREHLDSYRLPDRLRVLVVRATERTMVEAALGQFRRQKDLEALRKAFPEAMVREVLVPRALLTPAWADALHGDGKGGDNPGAILVGAGGFEGLLLLERLPAETQDIAVAYTQVEAALLEQRLQQAFDAWLAKALEGSVVLVSRRLLHEQPDEDLPPEPTQEPEGEEPSADGDPQDIASGGETR